MNGDRNYYASIGDTWLISPTTVADIRVGLTRVAAENRSATYEDLDYNTRFGVPVSFLGAPGLQGAMPEYGAAGGGFSQISALNKTGYLAKIERQTNWNMVGSNTKTTGRWTHKFEGEFRNYLSSYSDARGSFWFRPGNGLTSGNVIQSLGQNVNAVTAEQSGSGLATALPGGGDIQAGENAVLLALSAKYAPSIVRATGARMTGSPSTWGCVRSACPSKNHSPLQYGAGELVELRLSGASNSSPPNGRCAPRTSLSARLCTAKWCPARIEIFGWKVYSRIGPALIW